MRVPFPTHFKPKPVALFCALIFLGQMVTGTDIVFAGCTTAFIVFAVAGFNAAGGMPYPSGSFVFFNAVLTALLGLTYKIFLNEPGQGTLVNGDRSMQVYAAGMFAMMCAAAASARLRPKRGLLSDLALGSAMNRAAAGCLFFGVFLTLVTSKSGDGTLGSAFRQLNRFLPMAILLGATYEFRKTNGRRATNWIVLSAMLFQVFQGVISFSKEGMFSGPVTWLIAAIALGYNFRKSHVLIIAILSFVSVYYLVPYSQYVRNFSSANASRSENLQTAIQYLGSLGETRKLYEENQSLQDTSSEPHLYSTPQGIMDRLNMLAFDDALIRNTDEGNVFGLTPVLYSYANVLPHFIWQDKPHFAFGNVYGRSLGVISSEDETTGISFSPAGDAFHEATWFGVLVVWPLVAFLFFFVTDSLTGSARRAPWALLMIAQAPHAAPEGMLGGTILLTTYGVVSLLIIVGFARYVLPIAASIISRPERAAASAIGVVPASRS